MTKTTAAFQSASFFTNVEAQDFVFRVTQHGIDALREVMESRRTHAQGQVRRVLAACELIAMANGRVDADSGRCVPIEEWLFDSAYVPDAEMSALAANRFEWIRARVDVTSSLRVPARCFDSLRRRLTLRPRTLKRKPPRDDRQSFRELATWLNTSQGETDFGPQFDRRGNARVVLARIFHPLIVDWGSAMA